MVSCTLCARCNATVRVSLAITPWDWTSTVYSISIHIWKSNLKMCDQGPTWTTPRILSTVCQVWPKSSHVFVGHLTLPPAPSRLKGPPPKKKKVPQKNFNGFSPFCLPKKTSPPPLYVLFVGKQGGIDLPTHLFPDEICIVVFDPFFRGSRQILLKIFSAKGVNPPPPWWKIILPKNPLRK